MSEINSRLWNSGNEKDKETVRTRKRRLHYVSNVLVVSDPGNPDNEGKVFLYQYGKKIFDKIMDVMQPQFQDETPVNPFDFWGGANFKLKIRNFEGYRNYDKSEFDKPSELYDGDDSRLQDTYSELHPLEEYTDEKSYKSYDELQRKLIEVLGEEEVTGSPELLTEPAPAYETKSTPEPVSQEPVTSDSGTDESEDLSYFAKLAQQ